MSQSDFNALRLHSYREFQTWLARDLEARDELYTMLGDDPGLAESSLDPLEAFLLDRYRSPDDALRLGEREILDAVARHIGLVMLLNVDGAKWDIDLENEDNVYYRLPIIRLSDDAEECPLTLATAALDRRSGDYLRLVIENYIDDYSRE
jgi:hypothetical protein